MRATKKQPKAETTVEYVVQYCYIEKWFNYWGYGYDALHKARETCAEARKTSPAYQWRIVRRTVKDEVVK